MDNITQRTPDEFNLAIAPAEIEHLKVVDAFKYEEYTGEELDTSIEGLSVSSAAGQLRIRHLAATQANVNAVSSTWAEFGVEQGRSAYFLAKYLPVNGKFYLFDSFEGLPENWIRGKHNILPRKTFACTTPTFKDSRIEVVVGWFDDTLPMADDVGPLALIHIDCDLYSSTKTILERCDHQIIPGTVILFDELWGYPNWAKHEFKALKEWGRSYKYLARDTECRVAIEIL